MIRAATTCLFVFLRLELTRCQGDCARRGDCGSSNTENGYIILWLFAYAFGSVAYLTLMYLRIARPFAQKLEQMYETESYSVEAEVIQRVTESGTGYQGIQTTSHSFEVQYQAHSNCDNDDNEGLSTPTFITVGKRISCRGEDELRNNTVKLDVLKGFPLTGRRTDNIGCYQTCYGPMYFFFFLTGVVLIPALIVTPYDSSAIPYIFPVAYFTVLPLCCYLAVFLCMRNATLESYRENYMERDAVVRLREETWLESIGEAWMHVIDVGRAHILSILIIIFTMKPQEFTSDIPFCVMARQ